MPLSAASPLELEASRGSDRFMTPSPQLLSPGRAARVLGLTPKDLDRLTSSDLLRAVDVGGDRMYRASDLAGFVAGLHEFCADDGVSVEPPSTAGMDPRIADRRPTDEREEGR